MGTRKVRKGRRLGTAAAVAAAMAAGLGAAGDARAATRRTGLGPEFATPGRSAPAGATTAGAVVGAPSVTISVDRTRRSPVPAGFSGTNVTSEDSPAGFDDDAVRAAVKWIGPGTLRWPGGTVDDCFSWTLGGISPSGTTVGGAMAPLDVEAAVFGDHPDVSFGKQVQNMALNQGPVIAGKGGNPLGDQESGFGAFAGAVGARFVVVVNAISDTVASAQALAATVARAGLPVTAFELSNEPFFVQVPASDGAIKLPKGAPDVPGAFSGGGDYLAKMRPYRDAIKQGYASVGADPSQAVVAIAGGYAAEYGGWNAQWTSDLSAYATANGAWWDAVAYHFYPAEEHGGTFADAIRYADDALVAGTDGFMAAYRSAPFSAGKPLIVSEYGATFSDKAMNGSVYGGLFAAEYAARMSAYPETRAVLMHELLADSDGIAAPEAAIAGSTNWGATLKAAGAAGRGGSTAGSLQGLYFTAQVLGLHVADRAINASDATYGTSVTGSPGSVPTLSGAIPAVFAQAYHGKDGRTHVLVVNKGSQPADARLVVDGAEPATGAVMVWTGPSAGDPSERNDDGSQPVGVHLATVKGAFALPAYSASVLTAAP